MSGKTRKRSTGARPTNAASAAQVPVAPPAPSGQRRATDRLTTSRRSVAQPAPNRLPIYLALAALALLILIGAIFLPSFLGLGGPPPPATGTPGAVAAGGRISFVRTTEEGSKRDLFVMNADGSQQQQVTRDIIVQGSSNWSPDGKQLIVQATVNGFDRIVKIALGADNRPAETLQLTPDIEADSGLPVWSPDGSRIAFQSKGDGDNYQVFVMNADGNDKRRVSDGKGYAGQPAWSPDGKTLIYVSGEQGVQGANRDIFSVPVEGGTPTRITNLNSSLDRPQWSPDDTTLSAVQVMGERDVRLLVMNTDGSNLRTLTQGNVARGQRYSPSGAELTYYTISPEQGSDVYTIRVTDGITTNVTPSVGDDYVPAWSPDGKKLTWASTAGNEPHKIVVGNADGTDRRTLSQGDGDDYQPAWTLVK
jgi:Tol biopolymer transport system component